MHQAWYLVKGAIRCTTIQSAECTTSGGGTWPFSAFTHFLDHCGFLVGSKQRTMLRLNHYWVTLGQKKLNCYQGRNVGGTSMPRPQFANWSHLRRSSEHVWFIYDSDVHLDKYAWDGEQHFPWYILHGLFQYLEISPLIKKVHSSPVWWDGDWYS